MIRTVLLLLLLCSALFGCLGNAARLSPGQHKLVSLQQRAQQQLDRGRQDEAARLLQEALRLAESLDDQQGQATVLLQQARLARQSGNLETAERTIAKALPLATGSPYYADAAQERALLELARNDIAAATHWAETAQREEHGPLIGSRLNLLARLALLQGNLDRAARLAEEALQTTVDDGLAAERANALRILGTVHGRLGRYDQAQQMLQQALALNKQLELPARIAADLVALAELAGQRGDTEAQQQFQQRAATVKSAISDLKQSGRPIDGSRP